MAQGDDGGATVRIQRGDRLVRPGIDDRRPGKPRGMLITMIDKLGLSCLYHIRRQSGQWKYADLALRNCV
jgi:hypothetical protein